MTGSPAEYLQVDYHELGFGRLFESIRDAVVVGDLDAQRIVAWNEAAFRTFGYTRDEALGSPLDLLTPPRYKTAHADGITRFLQDGHGRVVDALEPVELKAVRKDGVEIDIELSLSTMPETPGDRTYALAIIRDITAKKRAEEHLLRFFDVSLDLLCIATFDGRFLLANPAWERVLGWDLQTLTARPFLDFVHPDDVDKTVAEMAGLTEGKQTLSFENRYRHRDGTYVWLLWNARPLIEQDVIYAAARDISSRKAVESELARSNAELEQFSYVASHDLQEPLRMVASYVQLLARRYEGKLDSDADEFINFAVDGATRMQRLINDLLAYSRVGRRGRPSEPVNLEAVLRDVANNLEPSIRESEAVLSHDSLPVVTGDAGELTQLFQNLIANAVKFRNHSAPRIHVGVDDEEGFWTISIRDNGIGIAPEYRERVFSVFQRLHTQSEYPGTGIGLAICQKVVDRHGGRIWVESSPGEGTTFRFTLPKWRNDG